MPFLVHSLCPEVDFWCKQNFWSNALPHMGPKIFGFLSAVLSVVLGQNIGEDFTENIKLKNFVRIRAKSLTNDDKSALSESRGELWWKMI